MIGSAPAIAIPFVGELLEGFEGVAYAFATAVKGLVRTSVENRAIDKAGGRKNDHGGVSRTLGNILKSAVPFFNIE